MRQGTDRIYLLARVRRDAPDLATRVEAGELTAHAAAVQAGVVLAHAITHVSTVDGFLRAAHKHLTPEQRAALAARLGAE